MISRPLAAAAAVQQCYYQSLETPGIGKQGLLIVITSRGAAVLCEAQQPGRVQGNIVISPQQQQHVKAGHSYWTP